MANASAAPPVNGPKSVPETSSSCLTQAITAAHNFEVINFSLLEGMGVGKFVSSRTFRVGGYDWNIRLYPDGFEAEHKDYVSVYLNPGGGGQAPVRVKFFVSVSGKDGELWKVGNTERTFEPKVSYGFGWATFMAKSISMRKMLHGSNDRFTVRCVLTVIDGPRVQDVSAVVVPEPSVLRDLAGMLRSGAPGADVTFSVGGRSFPAHRCVLAARSAVFRAELFGPMKEKAARRVRVDDMEPSTFEALLHFVYTDSLPDDDGCDGDEDRNVPMQHLLVAADRYGLDRLRLMCEDKMCRSIDVATVATTLA